MQKCECCKRDVEDLRVLSSHLGPISVGYCGECLLKHAEPEYLICFTLVDMKVDAERLRGFTYYKDGKYLKAEDWKKDDDAESLHTA